MLSALSQFVFGASSIFGSQAPSNVAQGGTWRDKKLCFDLRSHDLELDGGEQLIGCFYPIEDIKGNPDEQGLLKVTNLRLVWICCKKRRVNLSVGWRTVTSTYEQSSRDSLFSSDTSLFVLSKYDGTKYEFVFKFSHAQQEGPGNEPGRQYMSPEIWKATRQLQALRKDKPGLVTHLTPMFRVNPFDAMLAVWQAYKHTHLFRHCRSNMSHLVLGGGSAGQPPKSSDIQLLPKEELADEFSEIIYQSSDPENPCETGLLVVTNVRFIWIANKCLEVNASIPYLRIVSLKDNHLYNSFQVKTHDHMAGASSAVEFCYKNRYSGRRDFERILKLYRRFKPNPRHGPESCEDCIRVAGHLKPIGQYLDVIHMLTQDPRFAVQADSESDKSRERLNRNELVGEHLITEGRQADGSDSWANCKDDDDFEGAERDLDGYASRGTCYLNEQPIDMDQELIYCKDLGLAMEKPANGASIGSIWKIQA